MIKLNYKLSIIFFLIVIVLFYLSSKSKEGFTGVVPAECGTAGIRPSDGIVAACKAFTENQLDISKIRMYTPSECNKLKDGKYSGDFMKSCSDYGTKCVGLNDTGVSSTPSECMIDGTLAGNPNKAFSIKSGNNKEMLIADNTFQLYTQNECTLLKGQFILLEKGLKEMTLSSPEMVAKAIQANGKDYGVCLQRDVILSMVCVPGEKPTIGAKVSDEAKSAIKAWLA
jgi:hypothetical protein